MHSYDNEKESKNSGSRSLNPCFNGRCTRTDIKDYLKINGAKVLILVLMEDALVRNIQLLSRGWCNIVLILVLMEDALVQRTENGWIATIRS